MRTREDCLRRAALADLYASRVELQIARRRLQEIAIWWRSQAPERPQEAPDGDGDLYSGQSGQSPHPAGG